MITVAPETLSVRCARPLLRLLILLSTCVSTTSSLVAVSHTPAFVASPSTVAHVQVPQSVRAICVANNAPTLQTMLPIPTVKSISMLKLAPTPVTGPASKRKRSSSRWKQIFDVSRRWSLTSSPRWITSEPASSVSATPTRAPTSE